MPLLNREIVERLELELRELGYPKSLYKFSPQKNKLTILAHDQIHEIITKGYGALAMEATIARLRRINEYRLKHAKKKNQQIDLEDYLK